MQIAGIRRVDVLINWEWSDSCPILSRASPLFPIPPSFLLPSFFLPFLALSVFLSQLTLYYKNELNLMRCNWKQVSNVTICWTFFFQLCMNWLSLSLSLSLSPLVSSLVSLSVCLFPYPLFRFSILSPRSTPAPPPSPFSYVLSPETNLHSQKSIESNQIEGGAETSRPVAQWLSR